MAIMTPKIIFLLVTFSLALVAFLEVKKEVIKQMLRDVRQTLYLVGAGWKDPEDSTLTSTSDNWHTFSYKLHEVLGSANLSVSDENNHEKKKKFIIRLNLRARHNFTPGSQYQFTLMVDGEAKESVNGIYDPESNSFEVVVCDNLLFGFFQTGKEIMLQFEPTNARLNLTKILQRSYSSFSA